VGWGDYYENWGIEYKIMFGDTAQPEIWVSLREYLLNKIFYTESGDMFKISSTAIDAGYRLQLISDFCKPLLDKCIYPIKGSKSISAPLTPRNASVTKKKKGKHYQPSDSETNRVYMVGVNNGKDEISTMIKSKGGAGFCHFRANKGYDESYFKQLGAEYKVKGGRWICPKGKRNEAFDVRNYAYISIHLKGIDMEIMRLGETYLKHEAYMPRPRPKPIKSKGLDLY